MLNQDGRQFYGAFAQRKRLWLVMDGAADALAVFIDSGVRAAKAVALMQTGAQRADSR